MRHFCPLALLLLGACSSDDDKFACVLGEVSGTWRANYDELDGNCGSIASETTSLGSGKGGADPCTYFTSEVSEDKCKLDFDYSCPTTDGKGTQRWTGATNQVAEDRMESSATMQIQHPTLGSCRSTYKITLTRL